MNMRRRVEALLTKERAIEIRSQNRPEGHYNQQGGSMQDRECTTAGTQALGRQQMAARGKSETEAKEGDGGGDGGMGELGWHQNAG